MAIKKSFIDRLMNILKALRLSMFKVRFEAIHILYMNIVLSCCYGFMDVAVFEHDNHPD